MVVIDHHTASPKFQMLASGSGRSVSTSIHRYAIASRIHRYAIASPRAGVIAP